MHRFVLILVLSLTASLAACGEEVEGFGRTLDDAKADARQHALERLQAKIDAASLDGWRPSAREIENYFDGPGRAGTSVHVEPLGVQHQWLITVRFPSTDELLRRDRLVKRQRGVLMASLAFVAACGVFWGIRSRLWKLR